MSGADDLSNEQILVAYSGWTVTPDDVALYRGWMSCRLLIMRCSDCGRWHHPPKPVCPSCWSNSLDPTEVLGNGCIYMSTVIYSPVGDGQATGPLPTQHLVVVVELTEQPGLRIVSTLVNWTERRRPRLGLAVELRWLDCEGFPVPAFAARPEVSCLS